MTEVITYLIEHFQDSDNCPPPEDLGRLLEDAGFNATGIGNALMVVEILFNTFGFYAESFSSDSLCVFCREGAEDLSQEVMGLMQYLVAEHTTIYEQHEIVIHALMHIPSGEITLDTVRVLVLLMLWMYKSGLPVPIGDDLMSVLTGQNVMHQTFLQTASIIRTVWDINPIHPKENSNGEKPINRRIPIQSRNLEKISGR